jgi:hypothetical protein
MSAWKKLTMSSCELDELAGEGTVEQQVRQEVGLGPGLPVRQAGEDALDEPVAAPAESGGLHVRRAQLADVLRGVDVQERNAGQRGDLLARQVLVDPGEEFGPELPLPRGEKLVDELEALDVPVDAIEAERVQDLAQQEHGARERLLARWRLGRVERRGGGVRVYDQQRARTQPARRREGDVLAEGTVAVKRAPDPHGGEEKRDRGRGQRVVAGERDRVGPGSTAGPG